MNQHDFKLINNKLIIEAKVLKDKDLFTFEAIFDTGAGKTVISENIANYLELDKLPTIDRPMLNTVSGNIKARVVVLPSIFIFEQEFKNIEVAIVKLPANIMVSGLIGINLMYEIGRFTIDFKTKKILF